MQRSSTKKWTIRGALILGTIGLLGSVLGPSPLNLVFAPILSITFLPLMFILPGGLYGSELGYAGAIAVCTVWNTLAGAALGFIFAKVFKK